MRVECYVNILVALMTFHIYTLNLIEKDHGQTKDLQQSTLKRIHVTDVHLKARGRVTQENSLHTLITLMMQSGGRNANKTLTFR